MLRLSLANCPQFNFLPTTQKVDKLTGILVKPQHRIKRSQRVKGKMELYQEIDPTRNKILINIIKDVVAGIDLRPWNKSMICTGTQLLKNTKHEFPHVKQEEPIKMLDVFYT